MASHDAQPPPLEGVEWNHVDPVAPSPQDTTLPAHPSTLRILIVDDNEDAATLLALQIQTLGASEVQVVTSAPEALAAAERFEPHVVLLDLGMPLMDGYELARRLRQSPRGSDMRLIAVTGWAQPEHLQRTREAGFDEHLTKPVSRESILEVLAEAAAQL